MEDLDLTGNAIENIEIGMFSNLPSLIRIYLSGNKLNSIYRFTDFKFSTIDLSSNGLTSSAIQDGAFNVVFLNLKDNNLTTLREEWFVAAPEWLNLEENPLICDCVLYGALNLFQKGGIIEYGLQGSCNDGKVVKNLKDFYVDNKLNCTSCSLNKYQNGAKCQVVDQFNYNCSCTEKYYGEFCQLEHACFENPCQNNGTCLEVENTFKRNCSSGYFGERCEIKDACHFDNPCQNYGTCQRSGNESMEYTCQCSGGFTGPQCQLILGEEEDGSPGLAIGYIVLIVLAVLALIGLIGLMIFFKRRRGYEKTAGHTTIDMAGK